MAFMTKKDLFLCLCLLIIGFVAWFFPKPVDPVLFLGFSNPIVMDSEKPMAMDSEKPMAMNSQEPMAMDSEEQKGLLKRSVASP